MSCINQIIALSCASVVCLTNSFCLTSYRFVRTGQIERTMDDFGEFLDPDLFRVLDPKIYVMDTLDLFPFLHSTPVFPEWPLFAKQDVDRMVSEEVALAFINFEYHKIVGDAIHACPDEICQITKDPNCSTEICDTAPPVFFDPTARCDTTRELAGKFTTCNLSTATRDVRQAMLLKIITNFAVLGGVHLPLCFYVLRLRTCIPSWNCRPS